MKKQKVTAVAKHRIKMKGEFLSRIFETGCCHEIIFIDRLCAPKGEPTMTVYEAFSLALQFGGLIVSLVILMIAIIKLSRKK